MCRCGVRCGGGGAGDLHEYTTVKEGPAPLRLAGYSRKLASCFDEDGWSFQQRRWDLAGWSLLLWLIDLYDASLEMKEFIVYFTSHVFTNELAFYYLNLYII